MLTVLMTVMPCVEQLVRRPASASRASSPGALVWASSSTSATCGSRAMTASVSISSSVDALYSISCAG